MNAGILLCSIVRRHKAKFAKIGSSHPQFEQGDARASGSFASYCYRLRCDHRVTGAKAETSVVLPWIDSVACWIKSTTASGREIITKCDPRTWFMWALMRWAMNIWANGGMTLSTVPMRYHDGIVFQAGAPDLSEKELKVIGL